MQEQQREDSRGSLSLKTKALSSVLFFSFFSSWLVWWTQNNPLPDGYQNEYLHLGTCFDLFEALLRLDLWHLRWYAYTSYWAWGFYIPPWIGMLLTGKSLSVAILSNLWYLGLLIWSVLQLDDIIKQKYSLPLLLFCPAVYGAMTRFEPNFANVALMAFGLLSLLRSQEFSNRSWSILWGFALGIGLMMDRLTLGFFLIPAIIPIGCQREFWMDRSRILNLGMGLGAVLLLTIAYYREFFIRHSAELFSQAPVGEIDSAGVLVFQENTVPWLYYPLSLLDSQAGLVAGALMLFALFQAWTRRQDRNIQILLSSVVFPLLLFTIIAKKQPYYMMPALVPLSLLASYFSRASLVAVVFGMISWLSLGAGLFAHPDSIFPEKWTAPKYVLAKPPSFLDWDMDELLEQLDREAKEIIVFSEDQTFFEGFVVLALREGLDGHVRGITQDPIGVWEFRSEAQYFIWVTMGTNEEDWPRKSQIEIELLSDHYELSELPEISAMMMELKDNFKKRGEWAKENRRVILFERVNIEAPENETMERR